MKKKKAVLYCRSACSDKNINTLDIQEQILRKYSELQGYEIVKIIKESCSGKNLNRPGINEIYEIIDQNKVDAVIARDISRYGRCSIVKIVDFIENLGEKGVKTFTTIDGNLQSFSPFFRSILQVANC